LKKEINELTASLENNVENIETCIILTRIAIQSQVKVYHHLEKVSKYVYLLCIALGMSPYFSKTISNVAGLHDIAKVVMDSTVLCKPTPLTEVEKVEIREHCIIGYKLLTGVNFYYNLAASVALNHHERWGGSGYPNNKIGTDIPLIARIVSIADVFDALTASRVYKHEWSVNDALEYINNDEFNQFDPEITKVFLSITDQIIEVSKETVDF